MAPAASVTPGAVRLATSQPLEDGWELAASPHDADPAATDLEDLDWQPARVPGTVAATLAERGADIFDLGEDLEECDWWYRTRFRSRPAEADEEVVLRLDGLATVAEVHLNGHLVLESGSMFVAHAIDVGSVLRTDNELAIRFRALAPLLRMRRKPRARWRTRLVAEGNLRFFRTMLLGRAPGFAPGPAAVGPWRPVALERRRGMAVDDVRLRTRLEGGVGVLDVSADLRILGEAEAAPEAVEMEVELGGPSGIHGASLQITRDGNGIRAEGELRIPGVAKWWPHTHGSPVLHSVRLSVHGAAGQEEIEAGSVGFRTIAAGPDAVHDPVTEGLDLQINGRRVFARGAVWTPIDAIGLAPSEADLRAALETVRDAGMNMLRVPGIGAYESDAFHDLCDELGILLWQDFMFANLDYPIADEGFRAQVERESEQVLARLAGRPSLVVLCGNSEVEQQVGMLGLDPELGRGELFGELLPALAAAAGADAVYLPSAPCGGTLPFRPDRGVANYFGVGGYRRPLEDARRAEVRFASECLAFANVPVESTIEAMHPATTAELAVHHPCWKASVPRDVGSDWDFEDVRDHYLHDLFDVDPVELRSTDLERYLELSRAVSGEVMAEVFGEWRRAASPCGGGLVLWLRDLVPGAGWGLIDSLGEPKVAFHHLRRALAPVAVWTTDEGLGGVTIHVANDRGEPLLARLRISIYRDFESLVEEAVEDLELESGELLVRDAEALLGRFVDASWSYRFGPPAHDAIVASLERDDAEPALISQSFRFPAGRPLDRARAAELGLEAQVESIGDGTVRLRVRTGRLAYGVRVHSVGHLASDDAFTIEPGGERQVVLVPRTPEVPFEGAMLSALNLEGAVRATYPEADR